MAIKVNIGNLKFTHPFNEVISNQISLNQYKLLHVQLEHLFKLSELEFHHRDPFDRLIISQAIVEGIPIVSTDETFDHYDIKRIW